MKVIGVVGGIGSGKSTVAEHLRNLGSGLISGDQLTREALALPEVQDQIAVRFRKYSSLMSPCFTSRDGVDRKWISRVILQNEEEFDWLERLTYPIVDELLRKKMSRYIPGIPALVLDCPLLFECNWQDLCDYIVFVKASPEVRCKRFVERTGEADASDKWLKLENRQMSLEEKESRSCYVIINEARHQLQVESFWNIYIEERDTLDQAHSG